MTGGEEAPECPKCGRRMESFGGRERTVDTGTWLTLWCASCCHTEDVFVPRKRRAASGD